MCLLNIIKYSRVESYFMQKINTINKSKRRKNKIIYKI